MLNKLIFIDTETTGLDPQRYEAYEVAWAGETGEPKRLILPHDWRNGEPFALSVGHYFDRKIFNEPMASEGQLAGFADELVNATLVGSNPSFDAAHLTETLREYGLQPTWNHRLVNVAEGAMWIFGWDRPKGLADVTKHLRELGHEIPEPDHTAVGDVLTTRAVYKALRNELVR